MPEIVFLPDHVSVKVSAGTSIQEAGRSAGLLLDAPCGGHGLCGKWNGVRVCSISGERG